MLLDPGRSSLIIADTESPSSIFEQTKIWYLKNILRIAQISLFSRHNGNLLQFAIENSPFSSLIDLLKMVIFHSYVSLREGKSWRFHSSPTPSVRHGLMGAKGHKFPGAVAAREMGGRWIADLGSGVFYKNMAI